MGGGGSQSTTTQPWKQAQPFILQGYQEAQNLYNQGGPQFFPGQTYVSPSEATQNALQMAQERAMAGSPLIGQAQSSLGNLMNFTNPYAAQVSALGATANDPSADFYRQLMEGQIGNDSESLGMLRRTASGEYLNGNPYLEGALSRANRLATESYQEGLRGLQSQASAAGRYGSGAMGQQVAKGQDVFARALTEQNQQAYAQNYAQERSAQEAAIARMMGFEQQGIQNQLAGATALTSGQQQALATQLNAMVNAGQMTAADANRQLQAAQLAPMLAEQDYMDMQKLLMVGQAQEGYDQAALQDAMARWNYEQNLPYQNLQRYQAAISGYPMGTMTSAAGGGK
jgi:hypothetical protein